MSLSSAQTVWAEPMAKRTRFVSALGGAPWAVADQMAISAANFVMVVLLARGLSQADFGGFTLVYSVLLFANSLQSGLVTQPHNILGATRRGTDYLRFTTSTAVSQLVLAALVSALGMAAWVLAVLVGWDAAPLLLAMAPAMAAWQLQEFVRRVLYTEGRLAAALANDLVSYGGLVMALLLLRRLGVLTGAAGALRPRGDIRDGRRARLLAAPRPFYRGIRPRRHPRELAFRQMAGGG